MLATPAEITALANDRDLDPIGDWPLNEPCRCGSRLGFLLKGALPTHNQYRLVCYLCTRHHGFIKHDVLKAEAGIERTNAKTKRDSLNRKIRKEILKRDGLKCLACRYQSQNENDFQIDHIISAAHLAVMGQTKVMYEHSLNLRVLCQPCNANKGDNSDFPAFIANVRRLS